MPISKDTHLIAHFFYFHVFQCKSQESSSCPMLDFYITDSMQDMLDIDIKSEVATVVGGACEFTTMLNDLPALDLDTLTQETGDSPWLCSSQKWPSSMNISANDSLVDIGACVNPNAVMPAITTSAKPAPTLTKAVLSMPKAQMNLNTSTYHTQTSPLPSPKEKKSHLTFSPNIIKVPMLQEAKKQSPLVQTQRVEAIKKDLSSEIMKDEKIFTQFKPTIATSTPTNTIKLAAGIGGLTFANSVAFAKLKSQSNAKVLTNGITTSSVLSQQLKQQHQKQTTAQHLQQVHAIRSASPAQMGAATNNITIINANGDSSNLSAGDAGFKFLLQNSRPLITTAAAAANGTLHSLNGTALTPQPIKLKLAGQEAFPKPAYSYSCLIAMALKNSRAGSLPVSEIYSFMCEHFPYFKTAPNGWKNSVRHNLSLNKCFEKIEKPATNGGQRKGCLWAMNPAKIAKMDEEVQKWSRKDPMAIRKAMVFPENLESLERGEMKHGSMNDSDIEPDDTEDNESEPEQELEESIINYTVPDMDSCDDDDLNNHTEYEVDVSVVVVGHFMRLTCYNGQLNYSKLLFICAHRSPRYSTR